MTRTTFFKHFELLADQPDAVAKLRELVLQLAIRGQIVEQISAEQKDGGWQKFLKSVDGKGGGDELPPFDIPKDWRWARLDDVADYSAARKVEPSEISDKAWVLDLEEIEKDTSRVLRVTTFKEKQSSSNKAEFLPGDVLYGKLRPYLNKVLVAPKAGFCTTEIVPIRSRGMIVPTYLCLFLRSPHFVAYTNGKSYGMKMPRLGTEDAVQAWIAVPPPAEQRRIVAKVDELMALCDELEQRQQARQHARSHVTQSAYHHLTAAKDPADFRYRFNFILQHSAFILDDVHQLRQAILQLAVQGRLVPQNPKEKSAAKTLADSDVDLDMWAVPKEEQRYAIPESWEWLRFRGVGEQRLGKMLDAQKNRGELKSYLRNTNVQWMRFALDDVKEMRVEKGEENELRLKSGDLLVCEGGEPGRCAIWRDEVPEMYFQKALHRIRPCSAILPEFLAMNLQVDCRNEVLSSFFTGATIKHFTGRSLSSYPVPIPPLAEQKRIVARVEELLRWCDTLEGQLHQTRTLGAHLLASTLHHLLAA